MAEGLTGRPLTGSGRPLGPHVPAWSVLISTCPERVSLCQVPTENAATEAPPGAAWPRCPSIGFTAAAVALCLQVWEAGRA